MARAIGVGSCTVAFLFAVALPGAHAGRRVALDELTTVRGSEVLQNYECKIYACGTDQPCCPKTDPQCNQHYACQNIPGGGFNPDCFAREVNTFDKCQAYTGQTCNQMGVIWCQKLKGGRNQGGGCLCSTECPPFTVALFCTD